MTTIHITDLKVKANIGTKQSEQKRKQKLIVNITLSYDASKAIQKDSISDAVDYEKISKEISRKVGASRFQLIEKLADFITKIIMSNHKVVEATVRVEKPKALSQATSVSAEMRSKRK